MAVTLWARAVDGYTTCIALTRPIKHSDVHARGLLGAGRHDAWTVQPRSEEKSLKYARSARGKERCGILTSYPDLV